MYTKQLYRGNGFELRFFYQVNEVLYLNHIILYMRKSNDLSLCADNCLFSGGEKHTGGGRESGSDAWKAYMRRSTW